MSSAYASDSWERRQYAAPKADRAVLCRPSGAETPALLATNAERLSRSDATLCDMPLPELRRQARAELIDAARRYTTHLRGIAPAEVDPDTPLIVAGHQPELYHPGVWLKNFAASKLAASVNGVALNLIVDTDLAEEQTIPVPAGTPDRPVTRHVELDQPQRQRPWEDLRVRTPDILPRAQQQITEAMSEWNIVPIARDVWFDQQTIQSGDCLVEHLTRLRHDRQQAWDAPLLELPMRLLCRLPSFAQFVCSILQGIDRLSPTYNEGLAIYRRLNKLRSSAHPMPDLGRTEVDGHVRWEAPLWVWRAGDEVRQPLWIEKLGCSFRLFAVRDDDHANAECVGVIRRNDCSADAWHRLLVDLDHQGVRVRPRALMTTMFLRLCMADLFVHGIGGAKYDEVTDYLFREFLGIEPPSFLTVSGTLRLPLPTHDVTDADIACLKSLRWDLKHNPDRHGAADETLIQEKADLIAAQKAAGPAHQGSRANYDRFMALKSVNARLAESVASQASAVEAELATAESLVAANRTLESREFSWVLYPEELLRDWLQEASSGIAAATLRV